MKTNQTNEVLKYLKTHKKGITSIQAFELFGVTRLSAKVFDLKKKGYNIQTIRETGTNRYGGHVEYARYILVGEYDE